VIEVVAGDRIVCFDDHVLEMYTASVTSLNRRTRNREVSRELGALATARLPGSRARHWRWQIRAPSGQSVRGLVRHPTGSLGVS
jgi:hypothetical protein